MADRARASGRGRRAQAPFEIIVVEPDPSMRASLVEALAEAGFEAVACKGFDDLDGAFARIRRSVVFLPPFLEGRPLSKVVEHLAARAHAMEDRAFLVMATGGGSLLDAAREAVRGGAFLYLGTVRDPESLRYALTEAGSILECTVTHLERAEEAESGEEAAVATFAEGALVRVGHRRAIGVLASGPGVLTVLDGMRRVLFVRWADDLARAVADLEKADEAASPKGRGVWLRLLPTIDRTQEARVFDHVVNRTGRFPLRMQRAPAGARHQTDPAKAFLETTEAASVTDYGRSGDARMVAKLRAAFANQPRDRETLEWLAFSLYANDLLDEAIACYLRLIVDGSQTAEHYFYCGNALYKRGDVAKALEFWKATVRFDADSMVGRKAAARIEACTQ